LQAQKADFEEREYGKAPLSEDELREVLGNEPIEKFLNTRTPLYREKKMKQKPPTKEEAIRLMLKDANLLKRPVIIKGKIRLAGYVEKDLLPLL
jgi:arsenate reductase-like glutaredoxin family protein